MTRAPSAAKPCAVAAPRPPPPPVTRTSLFFASVMSYPKVGPAHGRIVQKIARGTVEIHLSVLEDVGVGRNAKRKAHVLFDDEDRQALFAVEPLDDVEDLFD